MKIRSVSLTNFRSYKNTTVLTVDDLTVLIGKNDVGKSTWLEALDIFFSNVKPDSNDSSVFTEEGEFSIAVSFEPPQLLQVDAQVQVNPADEYLLNQNGLLEIKKTYKDGKETGIYLVAFHPSHPKLTDLLKLKLTDLKTRAKEVGNKEAVNGTKSSSWREVIREMVGVDETKVTEISIKEEGIKDVWKGLQNELPLYSLFKVDRNNSDQDNEVQDPLRTITKAILSDETIRTQLNEVTQRIREASEKVTDLTLKRLKEMNPELANRIRAEFPDPSWDKIFKPLVSTDDGVPLNKRGSGVRRMVLLSFFRAEMDRKRETGELDAVYAIEEPETSQHPHHQRLLIEALNKIATENKAQVILTTHSPQLVRNISSKSLRFLKKGENDTREILESTSALCDVVNELGELPKILNDLLICLEGSHDVRYLQHFCNTIGEHELAFDELEILPMNGGFIEKWVRQESLKGKLDQFHLYDKDADSKYSEAAKIVNSWDGCFGILTQAREIENYIHPDLINEAFGTSYKLEGWCDVDVPQICADHKQITESSAKEFLSGHILPKMTLRHLHDLKVFNEVSSWLTKIKDMTQGHT